MIATIKLVLCLIFGGIIWQSRKVSLIAITLISFFSEDAYKNKDKYLNIAKKQTCLLAKKTNSQKYLPLSCNKKRSR